MRPSKHHKLKRGDYTTVPFQKQFLKRVDAFLLTQVAKRLGITSRPQFFMMCAEGVLSKYEKTSVELAQLLALADEELKAAAKKTSLD